MANIKYRTILILIIFSSQSFALERLTQEEILQRKRTIENKTELKTPIVNNIVEKKQATIDKLKNELKETKTGSWSEEKWGFWHNLFTTLFGEKYKSEWIVGSLVLFIWLIRWIWAFFSKKKD